MFSHKLKQWGRPLLPLLIFFLVPEALLALLRLLHISTWELGGQSALITSGADLICLIIFAQMYYTDRRRAPEPYHAPEPYRAPEPYHAPESYRAQPRRADAAAREAGSKRERAICLLAPIAGACFCALFSWLFEKLGFYRMFPNDVQENLLTAPAWVQIIGLGIVVPAAEEMCYRGLVYERLSHFCRRAAACLIVSVLFAIGHGNAIQFAYALPMALLITVFYEESGRNIAAAILFHMGANLLTVLGNLGGFSAR